MVASLRRACLSLLAPAMLAAVGGDRTAAAQTDAFEWAGVERVIAFADVHGADQELRVLLREAGVIDDEQRWAAGAAHVVSLGDLLDRGAETRPILDLLMRLQEEARAAGGRLHVLLGNHEAMNLRGDLRYVDAREYAAYADLESASDRERARSSDVCAAPCPSFDERFPPGYFGLLAAFAPGCRYGRWLLGLPVAIRIDDSFYVHGGLAGVLSDMTLTELNSRYRAALAAVIAGSADDHPLLSSDGPNWYRGDALCHEVTESDVLLPLLQQFGVERLVIGHTPTRNARVGTRFDGRVFKLDTGMNAAAYRGRGSALILSRESARVVYAGDPGSAAPEPEGLVVAPRQLDDATVVAALRDGEIVPNGPRRGDEIEVAVTHDGPNIPAVFRVLGAEALRREVAAFRVDRLLGLGIVPATVERQFEDRTGVLQARPLRSMTETERRQQPPTAGWCSLEQQLQILYALDALTGNEQRTAGSILYDADEWFVYATSFGRAFGTSRALPTYLRARPPTPGAELRRRLASLDEPGLAAALGELINERERQAILARRDAVLAVPVPARP
jgi:hypothetical protein